VSENARKRLWSVEKRRKSNGRRRRSRGRSVNFWSRSWRMSFRPNLFARLVRRGGSVKVKMTMVKVLLVLDLGYPEPMELDQGVQVREDPAQRAEVQDHEALALKEEAQEDHGRKDQDRKGQMRKSKRTVRL